MAVNKYIKLSVDELKILRGHFIQKAKSNDLNGLSLGQICTDFDPYTIALFNCEKCNKQPEIKGLIKKRDDLSVVKWTVTCIECKKTHQSPSRTESLAGLTHQCLYFEQPHTFEQILFIQTAEPALVGHA